MSVTGTNLIGRARRALALAALAAAFGLSVGPTGAARAAPPAVPDKADSLLKAIRAAADKADVGEVVAGRLALEAMVADPKQTSPTLVAIRADRKVVAEAEALIAVTGYHEAVALLSKAWTARVAPGQPGTCGELGVALAEACVAPMPVEGIWLRPTFAPREQRPREALAALLADVRQRAPGSIEATLMQAWLVAPRGEDELLKLDLRQQVLARNDLLLPIRKAFGSPKIWQGAASYEALIRADGTGLPPGMSLDPCYWPNAATSIAAGALTPEGRTLLPRWSSRLEYLLGDSRMAVFGDEHEWRSLLGEAPVMLQGRGQTRYLLVNDMLWEGTPTRQGTSWSLLLPTGGSAAIRDPAATKPAAAPATRGAARVGRSYQRLRATLVHRNDGGAIDVNTPLGALRQSLMAFKPTLKSNVINGGWLEHYSIDPLDLPGLLSAGVPVTHVTPGQINSAFTAAQSLDKANHGRVLLFKNGRPSGARLFFDSVSVTLSADARNGPVFAPARPEARGEDEIVNVVDHPLVLALEADAKATGPLLYPEAEPLGAAQLPAGCEGRLVNLAGPDYLVFDDGTMHSRSLGGGLAIRPLIEARLSQRFREAACVLIDRLGDDDIRYIRAKVEQMGRTGRESVRTLVQQSVLDLATPLQLRSAAGAALSREERQGFASMLRDFAARARNVRRTFGKRSFGFEPASRGRLVVLAQSDPSSLEVLDDVGQPVNVFYTHAELGAMFASTLRDFTAPSQRLTVWPMIDKVGTPGRSLAFNGGAATLFSAFALQRGAELSRAGQYHAALTLYRESPSLGFSIPDFDAAKPLDRAALDEITKRLGTELGVSYLRSIARRRTADLLRLTGRPAAAAECDAALAIEYRCAVVPMLDELLRYANGYGYAMPPKAAQIADDLRQAVKLPGEVFTARRLPPGRTLDFAELSAGRTRAGSMLVTWRPVEAGADGLAPLSDEAILAPAAAGAAKRYRQALEAYFLTGDAVAARGHLMRLAAEALGEHGTSPMDRKGIAADINRIGALWLASQFDAELPPEMHAARLDQDVLGAAYIELETFVESRLFATGMSNLSVTRLLQPTRLVVARDRGDERDYASRRNYFFEWAPLSDDLTRWYTSGMAMNEIKPPSWLDVAHDLASLANKLDLIVPGVKPGQ